MSDERAVDEGLLIASAALIMAVKNAIIVAALRDGRPYDGGEVARIVRAELHGLANENQSNSERLGQLAEEVLLPHEKNVGSENYNKRDNPALLQRSGIHDRVSDELRRLSADDEYIAQVVETARAAAWIEVGGAIQARLLRTAPPPPDPRYDEEKDARLKSLLKVDLHALERRSQKRKAQKKAKKSRASRK
jgi:hypothetical protein